MNKGLRPLPHDDRDFKVGQIMTLPKLEELPKEFELPTLGVKNQYNSDFCSAFASTLVSESQEGTILSPEWHFAVSKKISNDVKEWGQDLRTACEVSVKYGDINQKDAPFTLDNKEADFLRDINNWPDLFNLAIRQKKKSYIKVKGPYDDFDDIRATLYKLKTPIMIGLTWSWGLNHYELKGTKDDGFGHAITVIGWNDKGLILQNSVGVKIGLNGKHVMGREEINHFVSMYGAFTFIDFSPDEIKELMKRGIMIEQLNLLNKVLILMSILIKKLNETTKKTLGFIDDLVEGVFSKRN